MATMSKDSLQEMANLESSKTWGAELPPLGTGDYIHDTNLHAFYLHG